MVKDKKPRKISIIIPVYNEEHLITSVIQEVMRADTSGVRKEILVVDDGSTDQTVSKIKGQMSKLKSERQRSKIMFIEQKKNQGKGAALKKGFKAATGDILMVQDADEEYSTKDYPALLSPFINRNAQVVYGSRNKKRENFHNRYSYFIFYVGGLALTWIVNMLYGLRLTDQPTGYKLFSKEVKHLLLKPKENRFSYEVAVTALLAREGMFFFEVPIHYKPRTMGEGKKINGMDFIKSIIVAIKYRIK